MIWGLKCGIKECLNHPVWFPGKGKNTDQMGCREHGFSGQKDLDPNSRFTTYCLCDLG